MKRHSRSRDRFGLFVGIALLICLSSTSGNGWNFVDPGSDVERALAASLSMPLPDENYLTVDEIRQIAATAGTIHDYPNAHAIILLSRDRTVFEPGGNFHLVQQQAIKILTDEGADKYSTVELYYGLPYERLRILEAGIVSSDGIVTHIAQDQILDIADSEDADVNIFEPIWRLRIIPFSGLKPGAIIFYTYEECSIRARSPGAFHWGHTFRGSEPIARASICIRGPAAMPLHWKVVNDPGNQVVFKQETDGENLLYCWDSHRMSMIESESGMVPVGELKTKLLASSETWTEFSKREAGLIEPQLVPDDAIRAKVRELTDALSDPEEKIRALFHYVTRRVRYLGVAFGERPGVDPDPVIRTFKNNAGVCKDKAGLLTAMLRVAGIQAYYTLNNPSLRLFPDIAVDQFNHAVVAARLPGEETFRYLDVTTDLEIDMCPASSGGTGVLRINTEGADIDYIPISGAQANTGWIQADSVLDETGRYSSVVHYRGEGARDAIFRYPLYYFEPSKHAEFAGYLIEQISPGAVLDSFNASPSQLDDLTVPITWKLEYNIPDYPVTAGKYTLFKIPGVLSPFDWIHKDLTKRASLKKRELEMDLHHTSAMEFKESVSFPDNYRVKVLPDPVSVSGGPFTFTQSFSVDGNSIQLNQKITVTAPRVTVSEFPRFKAAVNEMKKAAKTFVILEVIP